MPSEVKEFSGHSGDALSSLTRPGTKNEDWSTANEPHNPYDDGKVNDPYATRDPMNLDEYNNFCESLPATTHVVQWGNAHVWKVGGKVFATAGWSDGEATGITFKTSPTEFHFLAQMPGLRPAPYMAARGMTWIQHYQLPGLDDDDLREQLADSHRIVAAGLSKKKRADLGLTDD